MKKTLLIMLVFGISLFISSMAFAAPNHGDIEDCDALIDDGEAYELCASYCFSKACATDDPAGNPKSCAVIKGNYLKVTGNEDLPCDIITCGVCADPDGFGSAGVCEERKLVDCADPMQSYGAGVDCADVALPIALDPNNTYGAVGCANMPGYIPDCQNGLPGFICGAAWAGLAGSYALPAGEECPSLPSCFEE